MKRIVVTGAKGGTGRSIVQVLSAAGYDVLGLDLAMPGHREGGYRHADVLDGASLHELFAGADGVVHFGSLPTDNWTSNSTCYRNMMLGGYNVLQACAQAGIRRLVYASSMEVYGDLRQQPQLPITEDSPLTTSSPWSWITKSPHSCSDSERPEGLRVSATPVPERGPRLPNTIVCTITAVRHSSATCSSRR